MSADGRRCSLLDLYDGRLTIVVGSDAGPWRRAATAAPVPLEVLGVGDEIQGVPNGFAIDDGLTDGGAVLVRPDGHVSWSGTRTTDPATTLLAGIDLTIGRARRAVAAA